MLLRAVTCAALLCVPTPASVATVEPTGIPTIPNLRVTCLVGMGTAFRIGPKLAISAAHVTSLPVCAIEGKLITAKAAGKDQDFSVIPLETEGPYLRIDCNGFVKGRRYIARGYARNAPHETSIELVAAGRKWAGFDVLEGMFTVIPGMSGGPIYDAETGKVVGINNVYNYQIGHSGSVPLSETSVCR